MSRFSLKQKITERVTLGRSVTSDQFEIVDKNQFEKNCLEYISLDRTIKTLEAKREKKKHAILTTNGVDPDNLTELIVVYRRKRISRIKIFLNRFKYDIEKLYERLKDEHLGAFNQFISEGTAFRISIPSTPKTRRSDINAFETFVRTQYPKADITAYAGSALEPIVDEFRLLDYCREHKVPLTGTREPVYNFTIETS